MFGGVFFADGWATGEKLIFGFGNNVTVWYLCHGYCICVTGVLHLCQGFGNGVTGIF